MEISFINSCGRLELGDYIKDSKTYFNSGRLLVTSDALEHMQSIHAFATTNGNFPGFDENLSYYHGADVHYMSLRQVLDRLNDYYTNTPWTAILLTKDFADHSFIAYVLQCKPGASEVNVLMTIGCIFQIECGWSMNS